MCMFLQGFTMFNNNINKTNCLHILLCNVCPEIKKTIWYANWLVIGLKVEFIEKSISYVIF